MKLRTALFGAALATLVGYGLAGCGQDKQEQTAPLREQVASEGSEPAAVTPSEETPTPVVEPSIPVSTRPSPDVSVVSPPEFLIVEAKVDFVKKSFAWLDNRNQTNVLDLHLTTRSFSDGFTGTLDMSSADKVEFGSKKAWACRNQRTLKFDDIRPEGRSKHRLVAQSVMECGGVFKNIEKYLNMWITFTNVRTAEDPQVIIPKVQLRLTGK